MIWLREPLQFFLVIILIRNKGIRYWFITGPGKLLFFIIFKEAAGAADHAVPRGRAPRAAAPDPARRHGRVPEHGHYPHG